MSTISFVIFARLVHCDLRVKIVYCLHLPDILSGNVKRTGVFGAAYVLTAEKNRRNLSISSSSYNSLNSVSVRSSSDSVGVGADGMIAGREVADGTGSPRLPGSLGLPSVDEEADEGTGEVSRPLGEGDKVSGDGDVDVSPRREGCVGGGKNLLSPVL